VGRLRLRRERVGLPGEAPVTEDLAAEEALATGGTEIVVTEHDLIWAGIEGPALKPGAGRAALRHRAKEKGDEAKRKKSAESRKLRAESLTLPARKWAWP
jgi:hypothetical protein